MSSYETIDFCCEVFWYFFFFWTEFNFSKQKVGKGITVKIEASHKINKINQFYSIKSKIEFPQFSICLVVVLSFYRRSHNNYNNYISKPQILNLAGQKRPRMWSVSRIITIASLFYPRCESRPSRMRERKPRSCTSRVWNRTPPCFWEGRWNKLRFSSMALRKKLTSSGQLRKFNSWQCTTRVRWEKL